MGDQYDALYMRAGAVPSLTLVILEVSDYGLLVADMSRDRIKVCVPVHDPDLSIASRPQHVVLFIGRNYHTQALLVYRIGSVVWAINTRCTPKLSHEPSSYA